MTLSASGLITYLYGYRHDWHRESDGHLVIVPRRVDEHVWENRRVQSGFLGLPGADNVSAVVFNRSTTISKFNRMGVFAGFGSSRVRLERQRQAVSHDPNASEPIPFRMLVNGADYIETWVEGADVFHNPYAVVPLSPDMLPGAAHHRLASDGTLESMVPEWHPLGSVTTITVLEH
ncbi:MAG TPA: hypothetical protein VIF82_12925 [Burkholderiaceae bacterium]|jgi:hypothetical protein